MLCYLNAEETKEAFVQVFSPEQFDGPDIQSECTSHAGQTPAKPNDAFFPQILEEEADEANECSDDIEEAMLVHALHSKRVCLT